MVSKSWILLLAAGWCTGASESSVIWTGWFSDMKCAPGRVKSGYISSTNPECSKRCIEGGAAPAFISEQAQAVFTVKGFPGAVEELGFHVEVEGLVDNSARTFTVLKVKQLEREGAACGRPRKKQ